MKTRYGFTLLEVLVVIGVLGVLAGIVASSLRSDRFAVGQAAQGVSAQVARARLEAIKNNGYAGLALQTAAPGGYVVWLDQNLNQQYDPGTDRPVQTVRMGEGELGQVRLGTGTFLGIVFDPRGIPQGQAGGDIVLTNRSGSFTQTVRVSPQGRASIQ